MALRLSDCIYLQLISTHKIASNQYNVDALISLIGKVHKYCSEIMALQEGDEL